jgi:hypothetical protein
MDPEHYYSLTYRRATLLDRGGKAYPYAFTAKPQRRGLLVDSCDKSIVLTRHQHSIYYTRKNNKNQAVWLNTFVSGADVNGNRAMDIKRRDRSGLPQSL